MVEDLPVASVQYNDMKGTSALDWHDILEFGNFLKLNGIDTEKYFPVSLSIHGLEFDYFSVYLADREILISFDSIAKYAEENNGILPVKKFTFSSNISDFTKYAKRMEIVLHREIPYVEKFDIIEEKFLE